LETMLLRDGNGGSNEKPAKYDLEERTARFGEAIIRFAKKIPQSPVNSRLIDQLVGAATSVGANNCEAEDAVSRKDFRNTEARQHWQEAKELHLIFCFRLPEIVSLSRPARPKAAMTNRNRNSLRIGEPTRKLKIGNSVGIGN